MGSEQNKFEKVFAKRFKDIRISLKEAEENRKILKEIDPCSYPITCLNDFLYGVMPSELIVVGADTGVGKTWLANEFAKVNALRKKKVYLFSLEGEDNEVVERFRYQIIAREYFKKPDGRYLSYTNYLLGKVTIDTAWEEQADKEILEMQGYLNIYDKSEGLTIESLTQQMAHIKDADLVVIDHLHYFFFRDDKPESTQITEIMRRIKDLTEINNIPVVIVSHLRKKEKDRGIPDNEDLMGSSNIAKNASKTIFISIDYDGCSENFYPTIVRMGKDRYGMQSNIGFINKFDIQTHRYADDYVVVKINGKGKHEGIEAGKMPFWIKSLYNRTAPRPAAKETNIMKGWDE